MDWTSVFEEDGNEDFLISQQLTVINQHQAPRLGRLVSLLYHHDDGDAGEDQALPPESEIMDMSEHRLFQLTTSASASPQPCHDKHGLTRTASDAKASSHTNNTNNHSYSLQALYYLSINYILGVGCLGVPFAFARAGFMLSGAIMVVVTLFSYMTVMWVAEVGERYHDYHYCREQQQQSQQRQQQQPRHPTEGEGTPLLPHNASSDSRVDAHNHNNNHHHQHWDRYEVVDLVGFYLGPLHKILYQICLMALMYIGLLAYSQVFCSAVQELLWGPHQGGSTSSGIPQLVFGVMVIPLSCIELDEQISIQTFMAAVRFLAIFIMVFGSVLGLLADRSNHTNTNTTTMEDDHFHYHGPPYWAPSEPENCQMSYTVCISGFGVAFSTALFSQLFQHSIPGLLRPLRDQPTKHAKVPKTLGASLLTTLSFYLLLGTSAASYFGASTRSSVNLNFANFTMGLDADNAPQIVLMMLHLAANIVVIFPALDTISVFPLIANTLGNNLCAAAVGPKTIKGVARFVHYVQQQDVLRTWIPGRNHNNNHQPNNQHTFHRLEERTKSFIELRPEEQKKIIELASKLTTLSWRLVAAVPPLLGSLVAADLSFSLLLAGVAGVYVAFFAPSLLQIKSASGSFDVMDSQSNTNMNSTISTKSKTVFHGWYSNSWMCYPVLAFATFSTVAVLIQIKGAWMTMRS